MLARKRRRDFGRQKWQFITVLITVALGVGLFSGTFNAYLNLGSSLDASYERLALADLTVTGAEEGFVDTAAAIDGVEVAIQRRQVDLPFEFADDSLVGRIIGMPSDAQPVINMIDIEEGTYLDPAVPDGVVLETHAAKTFDLGVGDSFLIAGQLVHVVGIGVSPEYLWLARDRQSVMTAPKSFAVAFVAEEILEAASGPALADQVLVLYDDDEDVEALDAAVISAAHSAGAGDVQTLADQPSNATIHLEIDGLKTMAVALPVLFLLAAGMAIYVVITRLVYSQRGVIGTLRASGFTRSTMSKHYRLYGISVGLVGAAFGAVFGAIMARGMTYVYTQVFGIPDLVAKFHLPTVVLGLSFGAIAGALAAIAPARTVSAMAPAEAMRGDAPTEGGKRSIFETLIPPLRNAPVRWRMSLRGVGRNKKRSGSMIVGVVLSMTLILGGWGVMDTMLLSVNRQFNDVAIEDATVVMSVLVRDEQVAAVADVNGVAIAEPVLGMQVTVRHGGEFYGTLLEGYQPDTQVHGFADVLPAEGVLLGQAMKDLLEVEVGDEVVLELPTLETQITVVVADFVNEPLGTVAYMQSSTLGAAIEDAEPSITTEVLSSPSITTVKAVYESGTDSAVVIRDIQDLDEVAAAIGSNEIRELIQSMQKFFYVFILMMLVFGGAMAFALIFNIISVNVSERSGEFASMRANGLTHRRVAALIGGETALLTAMGIVPGLIVGYMAAVALTNSFSTDQFPITAELRVASFIGAVIAMFVVAGLSLIPAIRAVKRINVGEIVRERSA